VSITQTTRGKDLRTRSDFEDIDRGSAKVGDNLAAEEIRAAAVFFATVFQ
jgi:hypothetical protein